jgi:predicted Na+-dependent transporter
MSAKAEIKHTVALFAIAPGGLALVVAVVTAVVAINSDKAGWFGCTAVCGLFGLLQVRRGLKMRNRAVEEGASIWRVDEEGEIVPYVPAEEEKKKREAGD